ncbi:MAG: FAD-dependent oxidoreductase [Candidatus Zixiibacteriota bacterium]|nr:MAG: FAD-dependent oxidoreductase [candidate division Zixibacteria bacterium]
MVNTGFNSPDAGNPIPLEIQHQLKSVLDQLPNPVPLYLFTQKGSNDIYNRASSDVLRSFKQLSDRIELQELSFDHELAKKWQVEVSPTILLDPERYPIRFLGAPIGEEGRTLLEAIVLMGLRRTNLSDQSLKIIEKIDSPRRIKIFSSPTCPYCPQQAVNGLKSVIARPELISLEIIDIQANPRLADLYSAHGVPQTFADDVLFAQGAQPEELFALSVLKMEEQTVFIPEIDAELVDADLVIVGGGPAGLTAGIYAERSGLKTAVVERNTLGGQVATTPIVENYPGFTQVGGKALVDLLVSHALEYVTIFQGEEVAEIQSGEVLTVVTNRRRFQTKAVLLATGASHKHLGVPGESRLSGRGVTYCSTCDGPLFKDKKVVMVGGGNSAVTEALYLHNIGVDVTLVHRRDSLRAQERLTKYLFSIDIPILWNTEVREIRGEDKVTEVLLYNNITQETSTMPVDGVFVAIGYLPAVELAQKLGVELTPDGFIKRDAHHRTNIPGIYSAGDVEGGYKQIVTAVGQGAEAALSIYEDLMNPYWLEKHDISTG